MNLERLFALSYLSIFGTFFLGSTSYGKWETLIPAWLALGVTKVVD